MNIAIFTSDQPPAAGAEAGIAETIPPDIRRVLGKAPLLPGESEESFEELLAFVAAALKPKHMLEWISVWDVASLTFELRRLQRWKAVLFWRGERESLQSLLERKVGYREAEELVFRWSAGHKQARKKVSALLEARAFGTEEVAMQTFLRSGSFVERIEGTIAKVSSRRDAALREFDRRRDKVAKRLKRDLDVVDLAPISK